MTAFRDYYLVEVETYLPRKLNEKEVEKAKGLYSKGWHPKRTGNLFIKKCEKEDCWEERTCFHYCHGHHLEICLKEE